MERISSLESALTHLYTSNLDAVSNLTKTNGRFLQQTEMLTLDIVEEKVEKVEWRRTSPSCRHLDKLRILKL